MKKSVLLLMMVCSFVIEAKPPEKENLIKTKHYDTRINLSISGPVSVLGVHTRYPISYRSSEEKDLDGYIYTPQMAYAIHSRIRGHYRVYHTPRRLRYLEVNNKFLSSNSWVRLCSTSHQRRFNKQKHLEKIIS